MSSPGSLIRVLIANLPDLLAQIIAREIHEQGDMTVVGMIEGNLDVIRAVGRGVDVVILGSLTLDPPPGLCSHLLSEYPALKIMTLVPQENQAAGYWLDIREKRFEGVTTDSLISGIRSLSVSVPGI